MITVRPFTKSINGGEKREGNRRKEKSIESQLGQKNNVTPAGRPGSTDRKLSARDTSDATTESVAFPFWASRHHAETGPEQQLSPGSAIGLTPNNNRPTHLSYLGSRSLYSGHDTFTRCYWTYFWLSFLGKNEAYAPNATVFSVALRCGYSTDSIAG